MIRPFKNATANKISTPYSSTHRAVDYFDKYGTPLVASEDSEVIWTRNGTYTPGDNTELSKGYNIRLKGKYEWLIEHCQPVFPVSVGDKVKAGQIVAFMGNSGNVLSGGKYVPLNERCLAPYAGTHTHIECFLNGERIDPTPLWTEEPTYTTFDNVMAIAITLGKIFKLLKTT